ncbi:MAG: hypothetical protein ACI4OX_01465 [Akkermansia sp.]
MTGTLHRHLVLLAALPLAACSSVQRQAPMDLAPASAPKVLLVQSACGFSYYRCLKHPCNVSWELYSFAKPHIGRYHGQGMYTPVGLSYQKTGQDTGTVRVQDDIHVLQFDLSFDSPTSGTATGIWYKNGEPHPFRGVTFVFSDNIRLL